MPEVIYKTGDKVYSPSHGIGYVVCQSHFINHIGPYDNTASSPVHLLYIDDPTGPAYLEYGVVTKLKQSATPESIALVQNNILSMIRIKNGNYVLHEPKLNTGDLIYSHTQGNGIILSAEHLHPCNQNHTYYHVYYFNTDTFAIEALGRFRLQQRKTDNTRQEAIRIINEKLLRPTFSA